MRSRQCPKVKEITTPREPLYFVRTTLQRDKHTGLYAEIS